MIPVCRNISCGSRSTHVVRERSPVDLVEVGAAGSRPSRRSSRSSSNSSSSSEDNYKPGGEKPPDYKHALKYRETKEDEGNPEPSLVDDAPPPPSYDTTV